MYGEKKERKSHQSQSHRIHHKKKWLLILKVWSAGRGLATAFNQCRLPWNVVLVSVTATVTPAASTQYLQYPPAQRAAHSLSLNAHSNHSLPLETLFFPCLSLSPRHSLSVSFALRLSSSGSISWNDSEHSSTQLGSKDQRGPVQ